MADEFKLLNYYTEYSIRDSNYNKQRGSRACFADAYREVMGTATYDVYIYKKDYMLKKKYSNACFLTKKQLINHLNQAKCLFDFKYSIKEEENCFVITVSITKKKNIYHRYLLNWIRYTYEFPFNMLLRDAIWMKSKSSKYKFDSIFNLFHLISHSYDGEYREVHSLLKKAKFVTQKELKNRLRIRNNLNSILSHSRINVRYINSSKSLSYWDKEFKQRLEIYEDNYNKKKNEK